jgi:hypothetical protein
VALAGCTDMLEGPFSFAFFLKKKNKIRELVFYVRSLLYEMAVETNKTMQNTKCGTMPLYYMIKSLKNEKS